MTFDEKMEARHPGWLQMTATERENELCIPGWAKMNPAERAAAEKMFDATMDANEQLDLFIEQGGQLS